MTLLKKDGKNGEVEEIFFHMKCNDPKVGKYIRKDLEGYCDFISTNEPSKIMGGNYIENFFGYISTDNHKIIYVEYSEERFCGGDDTPNISSGTTASVKYFKNKSPRMKDLKEISDIIEKCFDRTEEPAPIK